MHTNLYLVEKLDHQRRQDFANQAAHDYTAAQVSTPKQTGSRTTKRLKLIVAACSSPLHSWGSPRAPGTGTMLPFRRLPPCAAGERYVSVAHRPFVAGTRSRGSDVS